GAAVGAGAAGGGALVAAGAVGVAPPHAASSAAPALVRAVRKKVRRENLGAGPSRSIARTPSIQQGQHGDIRLKTGRQSHYIMSCAIVNILDPIVGTSGIIAQPPTSRRRSTLWQRHPKII